jgi:hypothetical protein
MHEAIAELLRTSLLILAGLFPLVNFPGKHTNILDADSGTLNRESSGSGILWSFGAGG